MPMHFLRADRSQISVTSEKNKRKHTNNEKKRKTLPFLHNLFYISNSYTCTSYIIHESLRYNF